MQEGESGADNDTKGQNKSRNVQREKNRHAAAKCRAKKKATSEDMQENHREGSKQNSYWQREMRELRDHRFNFAQAQQLAMGVGAMSGQPLSSSQESGGSTLNPGSDGSLEGCGVPQVQGGSSWVSPSKK